MLKIVDDTLLDALSAEARRSPRLRKNYNLHPSDESACHRLYNAIEPASFIRPHRHVDPEKDETYAIVRGSLGIVIFDATGEVTRKIRLSRDGEALAVDIPHGTYHTAFALEPGTIFLEMKGGPYLPLGPEEVAPFAPEEGSEEAANLLQRLERLFS